MAADDVVPTATDAVVEPDPKRQRTDGGDAATYPDGFENTEAGSGAIAPIEAPPPMEFNAEDAGEARAITPS